MSRRDGITTQSRLAEVIFVAFKFLKSNCVAVGTLNVYIIQPKWLTEVKIFPSGLKVKLEGDLKRPGFRMSSPDLPSKWEVRPDRLVVESDNFDENCGAKVASVLKVLKWTPLQAVGINADFSADLSVLSRLEETCGLKCTIPKSDKYELIQKSWHVGFNSNGKAFNFQLSVKKESIDLDINVHTELTSLMSHEDASMAAQASCERFIEDRKEAIVLAEELIGMEINHANNNEL